MDQRNSEIGAGPGNEYLTPEQNFFQQPPFDEIFGEIIETYPLFKENFNSVDGWPNWLYSVLNYERNKDLDYSDRALKSIKKIFPNEYKEKFMCITYSLRQIVLRYPDLLEYFQDYKRYFNKSLKNLYSVRIVQTIHYPPMHVTWKSIRT